MTDESNRRATPEECPAPCGTPDDCREEGGCLLGYGAPLYCDVADEMRHKVESYDSGWRMANGQTVVPIDSLRKWTDAMERASVIIEGPPA